jgi:hypothetical protein
VSSARGGICWARSATGRSDASTTRPGVDPQRVYFSLCFARMASDIKTPAARDPVLDWASNVRPWSQSACVPVLRGVLCWQPTHTDSSLQRTRRRTQLPSCVHLLSRAHTARAPDAAVLQSSGRAS